MSVNGTKVFAVANDVHGGFSFLESAFVTDDDNVTVEHLPGLDAVVVEVHDKQPAVTVVESVEPPARPSLRQRVAGALRAALAVVRDAVGWLSRGPLRPVQRRRYVGRHHVKVVQHRVKRTVLGRERSSYEYAGVVQQRSRGERTEEGDLAFQHGDTFVSWIQLAIEHIRYEEALLHPEGRHKFICS